MYVVRDSDSSKFGGVTGEFFISETLTKTIHDTRKLQPSAVVDIPFGPVGLGEILVLSNGIVVTPTPRGDGQNQTLSTRLDLLRPGGLTVATALSGGPDQGLQLRYLTK